MLQEFLVHEIPNYGSGALTSFPLTVKLKKKMTTASTTIAAWYERIKIKPILFVRLAKVIFFGVPQNFSNSFMYAIR